jgi:hypothetical protein
MSDKIKRLAKNITELLANTETPQDTYYSLIQVMRKQKDYFQHMSPENIVKLSFYCYSYAQTNSFEESDKMLNNIGFAVLFNNSGDNHREECDNCSGNGETDCHNCDGTENVECDECSGEGKITCDYCDGDGTVKEDGEIVTCPECDGNEEVTCTQCYGNGEVSCDSCRSGKEICEYCDGNGEIETSDYVYERYFIVTWNRQIKERCEYTEGDTDIAFSEYDFDRLRDEYIKLKIDEKWVKFVNWVNINEIYCSYYNDNPKMYLTNDMELDTFKSDDMTAYTNYTKK